ncbi:MAG: class I adenylate-forming enzyme family protein [Pseudomonadota bacterium]
MAPPIPVTDADLTAAGMKLLFNDPRFSVTEAEYRGNTYRTFANAPSSVAGLFAYGAATHGDKICLTFQDERYSFKEMWSRACRFANALRSELGVQPGDRVALAMRNFPEWCFAYMGTIAAGAVVVPLNAWWRSDELKFALDDCGAKIVIADDRRLDYIRPFKEPLGLRIILARAEDPDADYLFGELVDHEQSDDLPEVNGEPDDDFCIVYTSGSTGAPKGVVLTHLGCVSAIFSWAFVATALKEARGGVSPFGDDPGILLGVPLFHVTGSHSIFMLSYLVGRRVAMMYKWDAKEAVDIINRERLTNFVGVPTQSFELIDAAGKEGMPTLLDIGSGGAKRPAKHVRELAETFEHARPSSGYGLSETNAMGCVISLQQYQDRPDSTGKPVPPLTDIKIVGEDGEEAPRGDVGEIWIRSIANFREYLNRPDETAKSLTPEGWFKTGDLGKMDSEDYVYIVDRVKDLIIRGGENISCLEVENRAYAHADVAEATVFSVPCERLGEVVGLVFYPKDGASLDAQTLRDFMAEDLAGFKVPERIWVSPQALPRLGTAKVDKITVRKIALTQPPHFSV